MGLDVYAGTYIRYYARNWKTIIQQFAEAQGLSCEIVRVVNGEKIDDSEPASLEDITAGVHHWQERLKAVLKDGGVPDFKLWPEDNEKDYFTDKPDWDAYGAMLLLASAKVLKKEPPEEYQKDATFDHPYIQEAAENYFARWGLFSDICHYLPGTEPLLFTWYLANGQQASFATTAELRLELEAINALCWNADEQTIMNWSSTEGYPTDAIQGSDGKVKMLKENTVYSTQSLAKLAFSIFWQALMFSEKNEVPIILDY